MPVFVSSWNCILRERTQSRRGGGSNIFTRKRKSLSGLGFLSTGPAWGKLQIQKLAAGKAGEQSGIHGRKYPPTREPEKLENREFLAWSMDQRSARIILY